MRPQMRPEQGQPVPGLPPNRPPEVSVEAQELRTRLVEALDVTPEWRSAFQRVPRHEFVPHIVGCWPRDEEGRSRGFTLDAEGDRERWLRLVYSNRLLVTVEDGERSSSSSSPSAMARFLELLHVHEGNTILEIGTGSGYNAALLCQRLGSAKVTSIDIDPELVELARARLVACGYAPVLAVADGWAGYAARAPYDRIIATCSVPRIPEPWIDQLRGGGVIVAPLSGGRFDASGLVALRLAADGSLAGRLDRGGAAFMAMREGPPAKASMPRAALLALAEKTEGEPRPCRVPPYLLDDDEPSMPPHFLLRLNETAAWEWCWLEGPAGEAKAPAVAGPDGSWARVVGRDRPVVYQGGPRRLWDLVERNWERYLLLGKPGMDRYGITVTSDRRQFIWLDRPDSGDAWAL
jgi:protein-L-isoaspartate O-methyltransferase